LHSRAYDNGICKDAGLLAHGVSEKLVATFFRLAQEGLTMEGIALLERYNLSLIRRNNP
jgi:hypothetical protein